MFPLPNQDDVLDFISNDLEAIIVDDSSASIRELASNQYQIRLDDYIEKNKNQPIFQNISKDLTEEFLRRYFEEYRTEFIVDLNKLKDSNDLRILDKYSKFSDAYLKALSNDDRKLLMKSFVENDLQSLLRHKLNFDSVATQFVKLGFTKDIVHAIADQIKNSSNQEFEGQYDQLLQFKAMQDLIMFLSENFNSEYGKDIAYSMLFKEVPSVFQSSLRRISNMDSPFCSIKDDKMFDFIFRSLTPDGSLTEFQKKFANDFSNAYFESKKNVFDNHWLYTITSRDARKKFDRYLSTLLNTDGLLSTGKISAVAESKYNVDAFLKHLFFDFKIESSDTGSKIDRNKKERYYQRLIDRIFSHKRSEAQLDEFMGSFLNALSKDKDENKKDAQFFAQIAHFFKYKSTIKQVKDFGGIFSASTSYNRIRDSGDDFWLSEKKDDQFKRLLGVINTKISDDKSDIKLRRQYIALAAHLFVSFDQYGPSKDKQMQLEKGKAILRNLGPRVDWKAFIDEVAKLANPGSVEIMKQAIQEVFEASINNGKGELSNDGVKEYVDTLFKSVGNKSNRFRKDLVKLSKAVMIRDKKVLYDYVDVLQSWAEYNRKYENGNRTETLSVGSTPGSLKID